MALRRPSDFVVRRYWEQVANFPVSLAGDLVSHGFDLAEAEALVAQHEPGILAVMESFRATHQAEIDALVGASGSRPAAEARAFSNAYDQWRDARLFAAPPWES